MLGYDCESEHGAEKGLVYSPTGLTPKQREKHPYVQRPGEQVKGRKSLSFSGPGTSSSSNATSFTSARRWSDQEDMNLFY